MTKKYIYSSYYHLVVIDGCPFCKEAVSLLEEVGAAFIVENATEKEDWLREQKENYNWKTVPIVNKVEVLSDNSIDVDFIGGYSDLEEHMKAYAEKNEKNEAAKQD